MPAKSSHRTVVSLALFALACDAVASVCRADELATREAIKAQGAEWVRNGKYEAFVRQATAWSASAEKTEAGIWKLSLLYNGVSNLAAHDPSADIWTTSETGTQDYLDHHGESPAAVVLAARVLMAHAADWRGTDTIRNVPITSEFSYKLIVRKARKLLDEHRLVGSKDPEWYAQRIAVLRAEGSGEAELLGLVKEGLERTPNYNSIAYEAAFNALPKWGGNSTLFHKLEDQVRESAGTVDGPQLLARMQFNVARYAADPRAELSSVGASWPTGREGLRQIAERWPDPYNVDVEIAMACMAGDKEFFKTVYPLRPPTHPPVAWFDDEQHQRDCYDWVYKNKVFEKSAAQGPGANQAHSSPPWRHLAIVGFALAAALWRWRKTATARATQSGNTGGH